MSDTGALTAKMPLPPQRFVGDDGQIQREWYYLLISLYNRTGGTLPIPSSSLQAQINTLDNEVTTLQSVATLLGEQTVSLFTEYAFALTPPVFPQTPNPFIVSMMVSGPL